MLKISTEAYSISDGDLKAAELAVSMPTSILRGLKAEDERIFDRIMNVSMGFGLFLGVGTAMVLWALISDLDLITALCLIAPGVTLFWLFVGSMAGQYIDDGRRKRNGLVPSGTAARALEILRAHSILEDARSGAVGAGPTPAE
jgi:hypothetical protein